MGLVPGKIFGDIWDFLEFHFSIRNMRPMYGSERPMGPVPCRLFWDLWDFLEFLFIIRNMRSRVWL